MKILFLEDDSILNDLVSDELISKGFEVISTFDGEETLKKIKQEKFDLYLFDINVPKIKGTDLLQKIRKEENYTPTIFVTSLNDNEDVIKGFKIGCDDYIKKPFNMEELIVRISNIQRLYKIGFNSIQLPNNLIFNSINCSITKNGTEYILTKKEKDFLEYFIKNKNKVISFNELCMNVWRYDDRPTETTIRTYVKNFRKKFGEDFFITIKGVGYKLNNQ